MIRCKYSARSINLFLLFMTLGNIFTKHLPTGQHLESVLRGNMTYVDKTGYFLKIINSGDSFIFSARPPGFGKSFFVDMLQLIFKGNESKELFVGTEIYNSNYSWPKCTVLYFDFDTFKYENGELENDFQRKIIDLENSLKILPRLSSGSAEELGNLIQQISLGGKGEIVLLVDNYDAPIIKCLPNNMDTAVANFDILRQFFGCLKSLDVYIKLAFVTGVSRFPMRRNQNLEMDIFKDVTLYENYTAAMEFTEDEVKTHFEKFYKNATAEEPLLREKSSGYQFSPYTNQTLYHPHSVVQFFARDGNTTEVPKPAQYMLTAFREGPHFLFTLKNMSHANLFLTDVSTMTQFIDIIPALFQNGYLTIKNCKVDRQKRRTCFYYDLGFATSHIEEYFLNAVLKDILLQGKVAAKDEFADIRQHITNRTLKEFMKTTNMYLQRVNYGGGNGDVYRNLMECLLRVAGFNATLSSRLEQANLSKIDCIFELLVDRTAVDALEMMVSENNSTLIETTHTLLINDDRFRGGVVIGLNFDTKKSKINGCEAVWFNDRNIQTDYHYFHELAWEKPSGKCPEEERYEYNEN